MNKNNLPDKYINKENIYENPDEIEIGQWYWKKNEEKDEDRFLCIVHIGSNYVELKSPKRGDSYNNIRVHMKDIDKILRYESNPEKIVKDNSKRVQTELRNKMLEIKELTSRLGLQRVEALPEKGNKSLLPVVSQEKDIKRYKKDLIKAENKSYPKLFDEIKELNHELAYWLSAEMVPMEAMADRMEGSVDLVRERIFHVELYAGLVENIVMIKKGKPADISDKLYIMQRRCYMDEECLMDYLHGGINFKKIKEFDKWLGKKKNMTRILPFQRCIVSFKIRRKEKEYDEVNPFVKMEMEGADEITFLYIRNGDNLYRLNTKLDFSEKLFPNVTEYDLNEKMWAKQTSRNWDIMPDRTYHDKVKEESEQERKYEEWERKNPGESWIGNPYHNSIGFIREMEDYEPFDKSSVYYDDIKNQIEGDIKNYNRVVLILQGLFDRSEVLHPHNSVKLWDPNDFEQNIELVYDNDKALNPTERPPSFEEYRDKLNNTLKRGSITVGQQDYYERQQAEKEYERQCEDWRIDRPFKHKKWRPYGDPGPGILARVVNYQSKVKRCTYRWGRDRRNRGYWGNTGSAMVKAKVIVPCECILNIEAYMPGDYHKFFDDYRTRQEYIKWAPLLLAAEDYHAGKLEIKENKKELG